MNGRNGDSHASHRRGLNMPGDTEMKNAGGIASWYTSGVSDGLGDRLLMFDNTSAASLELLRFRPELVAADGFERALRESVRRLAAFQHPVFAQARAVERLDDDRLALVSTHVAGKRLSELFERPQPQRGVHPGFAAWLIGQLTPALAALHAQGVGVAHGVLTSDRIVLTQEGQFVIVECALGAAVDRLRLSAERLWRDLGIVAAPAVGGPPRLDAAGDIVQLALIAVSIVLGRRVTPEEYPEQLNALLDEFVATAARRSPLLAPPLRQWLERALRGHGGGFVSAREAVEGLAALPSMNSRPSETRAPSPLSESWQWEDAGDQDAEAMPDLAVTTPPRRLTALRTAATGLAVLVSLQSAAIAGLLTAPSDPSEGGVPVTIESAGPSDAVTVDGRQVGHTPFRLNIDSSVHSIRLPSPPRPAIADAPRAPSPAEHSADATDAVIAMAAVRQRSGGVRLASPIELQVLLDQRLLGSSADGPVFARAGRHELELVNSRLGYRGKHIVEIKAGRIVSLTVTPPDGRVSVNALPWAQVWIDGRLAGETPLANLPVPLGEHEITFRHPQLGERSETTTVRADAPTRVSVSFGQ